MATAIIRPIDTLTIGVATHPVYLEQDISFLHFVM
jgi:hypothetical protein